MTVVIVILGAALLLAIVAFAAYAFGLRRAVEAQGSPTPVERKIAVQRKTKTDANAATEAARVEQVQNASTDDLVLVTRDQLREDAATVASARKRAGD